MADLNVIADVSATLEAALTAGLATLGSPPHPVAELHDLQGTISLQPARVTVFLYEVIEDPSARNRPPVRRSAPPDVVVQKPPLALLLRYMLTPWSGDRATDQKILGRVMQTLYDDAILVEPALSGVLRGTATALKVTLAPITLEDRTRVWYSVQKPYRLSLTYEVRVVELDSDVERRTRAVRERGLDFQGPEGGP